MMRRRSSRSLATPPTSRKRMVGTVIAMPTSDIAVAASDIAYTCHASATRNAPSPISEMQAPPHSSRKSRRRSGASRPPRATPPARSSASWLCSIGNRLGRPREERQRVVRVHRLREEVALAEVAPEVAEGLHLLLQLDPLRDDLEVERRAQRHH